MAPLQADIAEIDAARLAADRALLDHRDRMAALAQEIRRPGPDQAAADDRNVVVDRAHGAVYHRGVAKRTSERTPCMADIRADILIFGTGNFAGRIALDLAATASEPVTVAIAGRNRERLEWLRTAGNARAAMFDRPARFVSHRGRPVGRGRGRRRDRGGRAEGGRAGGLVPDRLGHQQSGQCLDAARRRRRPERDRGAAGAALDRGRARRQGGAAAGSLHQLLLCRRGQSADRRARSADHLRGRQRRDPRQRVLRRARARPRPAEGARALPEPRAVAAAGRDAWRPVARACGSTARRSPTCIGALPMSQLTREPAIEISGASGVPLMLAMAAGRDWSGHVPGPHGLPGGYPVRLAAGEIELDLPASLTRDGGDRLEPALRAGERARGRHGRARDLYRAPCASVSRRSAPISRRASMCGDIDDVYRDMNDLRSRLEARLALTARASMRRDRLDSGPATREDDLSSARAARVARAKSGRSDMNRRVLLAAIAAAADERTGRPCAGADRVRRDHAALAAGRDRRSASRSSAAAKSPSNISTRRAACSAARSCCRSTTPPARTRPASRPIAGWSRTRRRSRCSASSTAASTSR